MMKWNIDLQKKELVFWITKNKTQIALNNSKTIRVILPIVIGIELF